MDSDLDKARMLQREFNDRNKTEPTINVQAIRFHDGRHAAIMRVRKDWMELWPLNKAVFRAGEEVLCDGTDDRGNPCIVYLCIGGPCGPKGLWLRARKVRAVRRVEIKLGGKAGT
jgi:hypothetical protein